MTFSWWHVLVALIPMLPAFWSIWDISRKGDFQARALWLAVVVFVPVLGGLAYIIWGRKKRVSE